MLSSEVVADFVLSMKERDLPEQLKHKVKDLFLDYYGVSAGAINDSSSKALIPLLEQYGDDGIEIPGLIRTSNVFGAALCSGTFAHTLELDDVDNESSLHPGCVIFSTALPVAQEVDLKGDQFVRAVIAGYEVTIMLGRMLHSGTLYARGFHPTPICGVFGAVAASGLLYGLSREQLVQAFGIAGSMTSGSMEFLKKGAWSKRLHGGLAAQNGIMSCKLAMEGFTGPDTIIEGKNGLLKNYGGTASKDPEILEDLGLRWNTLGISIKPHASCRYMQSSLDALIAIKEKHAIDPKKVKSIELSLLKAGVPIIAEPIDEKKRPKGGYAAQFSMPFGAAVALTYGDAYQNRFTDTTVKNPDLLGLAEKMSYNSDEELEARFPMQWGAKARLYMKDGVEHYEEVFSPKGDPDNPLSFQELKVKAARLTEDVVPLECFQDFLMKLEELERISVKDLPIGCKSLSRRNN